MTKLSKEKTFVFLQIFNKPQKFSLLISICENCFCSYLVKLQKFPYIISEPNKSQKFSPSKVLSLQYSTTK